MTAERWARIEEVFHRAVEAAPEERSRLLEGSCAGDSELRREVEALLSGARSADRRLREAFGLAADFIAFPLIGQTVSHYRVLEGLGGGGMGVVYKAQDARLPRLVALKFLPDHLVEDHLALERFTREANAASSLNHPNICTVYEFGEHEGHPFIAMELLEGQTLREYLVGPGPAPARPTQGSALRIDELLTLAIQIAEGLEAAHSKGITHRDIKPANIFITTRGRVKILDFGLAKLAADSGMGILPVEVTNSRLETHGQDARATAGEMPALPRAASHKDSNISTTGVAIGTAPYMSPEQVRGEKLDARSDLFSFGLVLHEMATGRAAFAGETVAEVYEAILNQTPAPLRSLSRDIPPKLHDLIHKALEKDREKRYKSAADLGADLRRLMPDLQSHHGAVALPRATMRRPWVLILGSLAFIFAAAAGVGRFLNFQRHNKPELIERELTANPPEDYVLGAAISPVGKHVAYVDQTGLYVRSIDSGETRAVSVPRDLVRRIFGLRWFPEGGKLLANVMSPESNSLWVIPISGKGAPRLLYRGGLAPSVSPDGRLIAFMNGELGKLYDEILIGDAGGGTRRTLVPAEKDQSVRNPVWSPDSRWVAYLRDWKTASGRWRRSIEIRPAGGGAAKTLVSESSLPSSAPIDCYAAFLCLAWSPDWRLVFAANMPPQSPTAQAMKSLWAVRVQPQKGQPADKPQPLAQTGDDAPRDLTFSADGKRLSFVKERWWEDVYLIELSGGGLQAPRRLTLDDRGSNLDGWTLDSRAILFDSHRNGRTQVFRQGIDESIGQAVVRGSEDYSAVGVSADGSWLLYAESAHAAPGTPPGPGRLMRRPAGGGSAEMVLEEPAKRNWDYQCPLKSGSSCVLGEREAKQRIFYSLDPVRGKGRQLGKIEVSVRTVASGWSLSPDGSRLASVDEGKYSGRVEMLNLSHGTWHELSVEPEWGHLQSIAWAMDGKSFFATVWRPDSFDLVYITPAGKVKPLLSNGHRLWMYQPLPSPDGKHLAFQAQTNDRNVWMLENF